MNSNGNNTQRRTPAASFREADDFTGEEYGPTSYARKDGQMSSPRPNPSAANRKQPAGQARPTKHRQNSMGFDSTTVKQWLADEPASSKPASKAKGPADHSHKRRFSTSSNSPRPAPNPERQASTSSRQGSVHLPVTIRSQVGRLHQSLSTSNNDVLRISTAQGMNEQVRVIAEQAVDAGVSENDGKNLRDILRRTKSGSSGARRSSKVDFETGDGYFNIKTMSTGIEPNPSTPLAPHGQIARSTVNSSTPGGTNSIDKEVWQTPGGSQNWISQTKQRIPISMSGPGAFQLKGTISRSKQPNTGFTPASAEVHSSAVWGSVNVS